MNIYTIYIRLVTAVFQLGEPVPKVNWTPWLPSFRYQEDKKHSYDEKILNNLMNFQAFNKLSSERMYKELVRAITKVGKSLMGRKPQNVGGRMNEKLKRSAGIYIMNYYNGDKIERGIP